MKKLLPEQKNTLNSEKKKTALQRLYGLHDFGVLVAAIAVAIFFTIAAPVFLTPYNLFNLFRQTAELGIIAMAMTILIISGEFDLSVGAIYAVTGIVTGLLFKRADWNIWLAAMAGIAVALILGSINGILITKTRMHSFIGTLAAMMVFRGIAMVLSQGQPVSAFPQKLFFEIAGRAKLFGAVPIPILWLVVWGIIMYLLLHRTAYGVKVFATGDNREAADLAGIKTIRIKRINFLITALAAGVSGIISLGYLKTVTPTQGTGIELEAANRELQSFAYVVSHDLKAPLRGISHLTHWLGEDYAEAFDEKGKEMIDLLIGRVKRMDNLIDGILQYSRVGRIVGIDEPINLNRLVRDIIDIIVPMERSKSLVLMKVLGGSSAWQIMNRELLHNIMKKFSRSSRP